MNLDLSKWSQRKRLTIGALAFGCAALLHAVAASGCGNSVAIVHDECVDAGSNDSGDGGGGGADPDMIECE